MERISGADVPMPYGKCRHSAWQWSRRGRAAPTSHTLPPTTDTTHSPTHPAENLEQLALPQIENIIHSAKKLMA